MYEPGDIILATIQFTDTYEIKKRPAVILFKEYNNIVIAGITSNTEMEGIPITKKEGAIKESVIKLNYIFTISSIMISKKLFSLSIQKKKILHDELARRIKPLTSQHY